MTLPELARFADALGWAASALSLASAWAGLWFKKRFLGGLLVVLDALVAAAGLMAIAAIRYSLSFPGEGYPGGFPRMDSLASMALSALVYLTPLLAYASARAVAPLCAWWYKGGKARLWAFVSR